MAINQALDRTAMTAAQAQLARVEAEGWPTIPTAWRCSRRRSHCRQRDLADCVHLFCSLYGRYPA